VLNDAGQVAYNARLAGTGVNSTNDSAIYAGSADAMLQVAREGEAAPGAGAGAVYGALDIPSLNESGQVAFHAALSGAGIEDGNNSALFAGDATAPQIIVREGEQAPGFEPGAKFAFFTGHLFNDLGQVAYTATIFPTSVGPMNGLFLYDPDLGNRLIARSGLQFDLGGGELRTVSSLRAFSQLDEDLRDETMTGLSDTRKLAFRLTFSDGLEGIVVATVAAPGDADLDGDVDLSDLGILATYYGRSDSSLKFTNGDFDDDGDVDLSDLGALASNYGGGQEEALAEFTTLTSVPEPAALGLLGLSGLTLFCRRRRACQLHASAQQA
jgi:hypothetical protein